MVQQFYQSEVNNEYVIRGNSAVLKCSIPSFVADFVSVVSWEDSKGHTYTGQGQGQGQDSNGNGQGSGQPANVPFKAPFRVPFKVPLPPHRRCTTHDQFLIAQLQLTCAGQG